MSETQVLKAALRTKLGKGASRASRRAEYIPAVVYGNKKDAVSISVFRNDLVKVINRGNFFSNTLDLEIDGKKERVLPRDIQLHPVTDWPLHVDFLRLSSDAMIAIAIPVTFINQETSPGLKRGGVLNIVRHEVELNCPANAILAEIVVDLAGLDIGHTIHFSAVTLPAGVTPVITDRDFTIATLQAPSGLKSEEAAAAEA
ncbi:50S ribosomal protein L25/general stress protein Ctc [Govanella unica]|uniref:Large ribosomal subunit protein bL25 n=1 Tax=Govanella unica TaxID=2975056 RepID=A0A9X3TZQ2_9PROT|nr:50S ribosomal protein L25/general stress protein Ctc [Govania unica]MDA5194773.1 50S ribosomal protein L25/general stress protein Ctc [Govania unica]